jgi:hypothetical protein
MHLNLFKKKYTPVLILGMHRSGTSCLAGSLQQCGLFLGKVFEENPFNKKGNRENERIMNVNNRVLAYNNGSWDNPPKQIHWNKELQIERDQIIDDFRRQSQSFWGFKDPRTLITLPFWIDSLEHCKFVGSFRNPISVAKSLEFRNGMKIDAALDLWKIYNEKLLEMHGKYSFPLISFDLTEAEYFEQIAKILSYLDWPSDKIKQDHKFFDDSLRNHRDFQIEDTLREDVQLIYKKLTNIYENQK